MLHSAANEIVVVLERRVLLLAWDDEGNGNDKKDRVQAQVKSRKGNKGGDGDEFNFPDDTAHPSGRSMVVDGVETWRMERNEEEEEEEEGSGREGSEPP